MYGRALWLTFCIFSVLGLRTAGAATTDDFINQAFNDLLGRSPTSMELSSYEVFLSTSTRQQAAYQIETADSEFHERVVVGLYSLLLHRSPTGIEESGQVSELGSAATIEQVEAGIAGTSEYFSNRGGSTDDGFLTAIFSDLLDRLPSSMERVTYDALLMGSTTTGQVAGDILGGTEYQEDLIAQYAQTYLHGPLSSMDSSFYLSEMQSSVRDEVVISQIIGSDQYFNNLPEPGALPIALAAGLLLRRRAGAELGGSIKDREIDAI